MLSITLRQLEYATAIARHGGVTAAANALHISQPALSVALAQLETLLARPLFHRRPGGRLVPNSYGRGWLTKAEAALAQVGALTRSDTAIGTELHLALFQDLAPQLLAPLIAGANLRHPELRLRCSVMGFDPLAAALAEARCDLAVTWDLGLPANISRETLALVPPHAVLAATHPLALKDSLLLKDLAGQPLVLADQDQSLGHTRALFAAQGLIANIVHRTASLEVMRSYAANGLGIGFSYTNPAPRHSPDGAPLVTRPLTDAGAEPVVLAHLAAASSHCATLCGLLREILARHA